MRRVLHGFELAELVAPCQAEQTTRVFCVTSDSQFAQKLESCFNSNQETVAGKIVRDWMALRLVLRRHRPDVLIINLDDPAVPTHLKNLMQDPTTLESVRLVGVQSETDNALPTELAAKFSQLLNIDCTEQELQNAITSQAAVMAPPAVDPQTVTCAVQTEPSPGSECAVDSQLLAQTPIATNTGN